MEEPSEDRGREDEYPQRKKLPHTPPWWVPENSRYFITINCVPRGKAQLCENGVPLDRSKSILESARHYHDMTAPRWFIHLFLLMPDHLHAILTFAPDSSLRKTVKAWKGFVRKNFGIEWQSDFFDHRLRNDEERFEKMTYIARNPVSKGLCSEPKDWPHRLEFHPDTGEELPVNTAINP
jgi:putative transposase